MNSLSNSSKVNYIPFWILKQNKNLLKSWQDRTVKQNTDRNALEQRVLNMTPYFFDSYQLDLYARLICTIQYGLLIAIYLPGFYCNIPKEM